MKKQNLVAVYQGGEVISDYINNLLNSRRDYFDSMSTKLQQAYGELDEKLSSLEDELAELNVTLNTSFPVCRTI